MELLGNHLRDAYHYFADDMVVSVLVSRLVTNPVQRLIRAMEEFEKDAAGYVYRPWKGLWRSRHCPSPMRHGKKNPEIDESGTSGGDFLRKTELKALQAQINPPFLI